MKDHKLKQSHIDAFTASKAKRDAKLIELKADTEKKATVSSLADRVIILEELLNIR